MFFKASNKKKIILHIGLPKTASTAVQQALYQHRSTLLNQGVLYPSYVHRSDDPKHNFLLDWVRKGRGYNLADERGYKRASRILLSNEALSNDFYLHGLERNRQLAERLREHGDLEVCMVLRQQQEWLKSYYKQAVINQAVNGKPHYQSRLTIDAFRELEPVKLLLDYGTLIQDVSAAFQAPVRLIRYEEAQVADVVEYCIAGSTKMFSFQRRHNESLSDAAVEVMRQLNMKIENAAEKCAWSYALVSACAASHDVLNTLAGRATVEDVNALDIQKIEALAFDSQVVSVSEDEFNAIVSDLRQQVIASKYNLSRANE